MATIEIDPDKFLAAIAFALKECASHDQEVVGIVDGPLEEVQIEGKRKSALSYWPKKRKEIKKNDEVPKKKRGRPKGTFTQPVEKSPKVKKPRAGVEQSSSIKRSKAKEFDGAVLLGEEEVIKVGDMVESIESVLNFQPLPKSSAAAMIHQAKRGGTIGVQGTVASVSSVIDPHRKVKFMDDQSVGDRFPAGPKTYGEPIPTTRNPAQMQNFRCDTCRRDFQGYWSEYPQALLKYKDASVGINVEERALVKCNECTGRPSN
jgi:hypothetical protein